MQTICKLSSFAIDMDRLCSRFFASPLANKCVRALDYTWQEKHNSTMNNPSESYAVRCYISSDCATKELGHLSLEALAVDEASTRKRKASMNFTSLLLFLFC